MLNRSLLGARRTLIPNSLTSLQLLLRLPQYPAAPKVKYSTPRSALFYTSTQRETTLDTLDKTANLLLLGCLGVVFYAYGSMKFEDYITMSRSNELLTKLGLNENEVIAISTILHLHDFLPVINSPISNLSDHDTEMHMLNIHNNIRMIHEQSTRKYRHYSNNQKEEIQRVFSLLFEIPTDAPISSDTFQKCMKELSQLLEEKYQHYLKNQEEVQNEKNSASVIRRP